MTDQSFVAEQITTHKRKLGKEDSWAFEQRGSGKRSRDEVSRHVGTVAACDRNRRVAAAIRPCQMREHDAHWRWASEKPMFPSGWASSAVAASDRHWRGMTGCLWLSAGLVGDGPALPRRTARDRRGVCSRLGYGATVRRQGASRTHRMNGVQCLPRPVCNPSQALPSHPLCHPPAAPKRDEIVSTGTHTVTVITSSSQGRCLPGRRIHDDGEYVEGLTSRRSGRV